MKQIAQNYKSGELIVLDAPVPACRPGGVLVQSLFSLISTGTEMMKVHEANLSMVGKARARPDQVRKVLDTVAQQGAMATYKKVMNKLDSYTPLGYSLCGVVIEVGAGAEEFKVGQLVAAAGNEFALHAEYNWIPVNLCAAVPRGVAPEHAAFSTVGAIAMQGVRRAEPQLGETSLVIGLGLVGQLVVRLLVAAGRPGGRPGHDRGPLPAGRAGGRGGLRGPGRRGPGRRGGLAGRAHQRPRRRPRVPGRGRLLQRAGRDRGQAGPGPGPGGRHRQDQAGPALERLLREGTRRPVLPVLRPGPVRRPVRAGGRRLPGRLRPLDRAPQPGVLPGPAGPQGPRGRDAGLRHVPDARRGLGLRRPVLRRAEGGRGPALLPGAGPGAPGRGPPPAWSARPASGRGLQGTERAGFQAPGHRLHRRGQLRLLDAASAPGPAAGRRARPRHRRPSPCRR